VSARGIAVDGGRAREGQSEAPPEATSVALGALWPMLGRPIAFHRRLVEVTASVKAALLLSQTVYWTRHGSEVGQREGWFHKTAGQWTRETGLSAREQAGARELLRGLALLEESRLGLPARLHFRVNLDELARRLGAGAVPRPSPAPDISAGNRVPVAALLGPALAFHRGLVEIGGGVHGGLLLSRALHLTRQRVLGGQTPWIAGSVSHWFHELGLTRREQEAARRALYEAGLWEERITGAPPRLRVRVRLDVLPARLSEGRAVGLVASEAAAPECGLPADRMSPKRETRMWELHRLVSTKPPSQFQQNRRDSFDETAASDIQGITGVLLQPPRRGEPTSPEPPIARSSSGAPLILPARLPPADHAAVLRLLRESKPTGTHPQLLLDELAGRLQTERVRSPVAYLRGLIRRAAAGQFIPELAPRIAAERERLRREAADNQARAQRRAAERAAPDHPSREQERRERVRAWLGELRRQLSAPRRR
jgi:hypothetical protein